MGKIEGEFLLINDNNTRTKFALANRESLLAHESIYATSVDPANIGSLLSSWHWEQCLLASVVPNHLEALREFVADRPLIELNHRIPLGVEVDFPNPSSIGADRLANAAAAADAGGAKPVVVVDFGTAVTFDILDTRPAYIGGVIAPGLDAMRHYLHQRTALLPEIDLVHPDSAIGKTTEHAMQSGAFHGYRGLVREILAQIEKELGSAAKVIATGGYAALIAEEFPDIEDVDPVLTMKGLLRVANLNFPHG